MKLSVVFTTLAVTLGAFALPQGGSAPAACDVWNDVLTDLQANFFEGSQCTSPVRKILRIVFHDSIGFSNSLTSQGLFGGGGADGSIIQHSNVELAFAANGGLTTTIEGLRSIALAHGVSFGDIIQFATAVGMSNCQGSPRLEFLAGRPSNSQPSPPSLIPGPGNTVDAMLSRMADAGFSPEELVDLLAAHSLASQEGLNTAIFRSPLDSTPQTFDTQFYIETSLNGTLAPSGTLTFAEQLSPLPGEFRMRSDGRLARDPRTACHWQALAADHDLMATRFRAAMSKMSLLGHNRADLTDCSAIIPAAAAISTTGTIPPGLDQADLENSCPSAPFPSIPVAPGAALPSLAPAP